MPGTAAAVAFSVVGFLVGFRAVGEASLDGWEAIPFAGAGAAAVLGWVLWRTQRRPVGSMRGFLLGACVGIGSHPLCWYLLILARWACHLLTGGCTGSLGDPPIDPLRGIPGSFVLSFWSWLTIGWLSTVAGSLTGAALGWLTDRELHGATTRAGRP